MNDFKQQIIPHDKYDEPQDSQRTQINLNPIISKINQQFIIKTIMFIIIILIMVVNNVQITKLQSHLEKLENIDFLLSKSTKNNYNLIQVQEKERIRVFQEVVVDAKKQFSGLREDLDKSIEKILTEIHFSKRKINKLQNELRQKAKDIKNYNHATNTKITPQSAGKITKNNEIKTKQTAIASTQLQQTPKSIQILQNTLTFLLQQSKAQYHYRKVKYLRSILKTVQIQKRRQSLVTAFNNLKLKHQDVLLSTAVQKNYQNLYERLSKEYEFDKYQIELPFCFVVPTYNNAKNYRYLYNIQSILNLNYTNYKVIIVDDQSKDLTYELILQYLDENPQIQNIKVIRNEKHMTAVPGIDKAIRQYCDKEDIAVLLDGDDQLLVRESLKVFNTVYQKQNVDVAYSNHLQLYWHKNTIKQGWSQKYTQEEIRQNRYRQVIQKISHLRTFKVKLYLKIKPEDLKDEKGEWYTSTYDQVICLPILEMSCGRIAYIQQYFYLYNFGIGVNDLQVNAKLQKDIADTVKFQRKKYKCLDQA